MKHSLKAKLSQSLDAYSLSIHYFGQLGISAEIQENHSNEESLLKE